MAGMEQKPTAMTRAKAAGQLSSKSEAAKWMGCMQHLQWKGPRVAGQGAGLAATRLGPRPPLTRRRPCPGHIPEGPRPQGHYLLLCSRRGGLRVSAQNQEHGKEHEGPDDWSEGRKTPPLELGQKGHCAGPRVSGPRLLTSSSSSPSN